jgi:hypothetical protein
MSTRQRTTVKEVCSALQGIEKVRVYPHSIDFNELINHVRNIVRVVVVSEGQYIWLLLHGSVTADGSDFPFETSELFPDQGIEVVTPIAAGGNPAHESGVFERAGKLCIQGKIAIMTVEKKTGALGEEYTDRAVRDHPAITKIREALVTYINTKK